LLKPDKPDFGSFSTLARPSNGVALAHLALQIFAICASVGVLLVANSPLLWGGGVVVLSGLLARNLEIAHALIHQNFFDGAPKWLNRWLGVLLVSPFLISWTQWRWTHHIHHQRPDIEGFDYPDLKGITGLAGMAKHHMMIPHWGNTMRRMALAPFSRRKLRDSLTRSVKGFASPNDLFLMRIAQEYLFVAVLYATFLAFMFDNFSWTGVGCVVLVQILAGFAHTVIELPEHLFVDAHAKNPLERSYEIVGSPIADFLTFFNTRHASHHLFPNVPLYRLGPVSDKFGDRNRDATSSYASFWIRFFSEYFASKVRYRI
jgi:fatty acid desaturase